ncbi:hypothetical protein IWW36_001657 [Coemansia brasiliensis]|uniref:Zn(2)-C6 fungal-type domain-containing protein n=1 Tax=Coemansia brasiliensis TaxID=2650707 RepID=A0A9W8I8J0_9FUNG|nr:hypothetical protein IWW36_001657 [Coemansia brasiliensis]
MVQNPDTALQPQAANGTSKPAPETTTEKKDEKAAPVRKRLSLACTTCRQRKVKCDGGRPSCRTCAKFNWPCIYQPSNRKRGPRPRALALMDGSMPYSGRSHWPSTHYYTYGIPGQPPISPPMAMPPPQLHQLMPPMPGHQYMEAHANGAPVHANPAAHDGVGAYNIDAYSTYSDYISSTGGIRIHAQGPPPHSGFAPMHSPPFAQAPQHPSHVAGGPARHRSGSHYQHLPHRMSVSDGPSVRPPPPLPPPPSSYMQPPAQNPQSMHRPASPFAFSHRGAAPEQPGASSHHRAAPMQQFPSGRMHMAAAAAAAAAAAEAPLGSASSARPELAKQNPPGSTAAPQHMHASAQSYTSASAHAHDMQLPSADALRNTPAIYARREADAASSRSTTVSSIGAGCARRPSQHTSPLQHPKDMLALSSPVQHPASHLPPAPGDQAMTAPIPSSSSFARPSRDYKPDCVEPVSAQPLPFSDGKSRPRLPPLTEVLGKDYQQIMSPGCDSSNRVSSHFGVPASHHKDGHL